MIVVVTVMGSALLKIIFRDIIRKKVRKERKKRKEKKRNKRENMASQAVIDAQRAQSDLSEARLSEIHASVAESQKQVGKVEDVAVLRESMLGTRPSCRR